jgi:hypothetical protein
MCHQGASAPKGLDLSSYSNIIKGGAEGPVILPNNSASSLLVKIQSSQHFSNFTSDELALIKQWIDAGAPEQ